MMEKKQKKMEKKKNENTTMALYITHTWRKKEKKRKIPAHYS